jgi:Arc/MetJ-type ribon-helix-helix transcriptional regulator
MENRVTVRLEDGEKDKIEARIKAEYPKIKNVSELVRAALDSFLDKKSEHYPCSCSNPKKGEKPCQTASI